MIILMIVLMSLVLVKNKTIIGLKCEKCFMFFYICNVKNKTIIGLK